MTELLETAVAGANLGPTVLLTLIAVYWIGVLIGVLGLDLFDFDLDIDSDLGDVGDLGDLGDAGDVGGDLDVDADAEVSSGNASSILSIGFVIMRFANIGRVPLMVWLTTFAMSLWLITILWDNPETHESVSRELIILLRNGALAFVGAKLLSQPLRGYFKDVEAPGAKDYIGSACVVTTPTLTDRSGQVRCETGAAPLLLNARTRTGSKPLAKGDTAVIVGYQQGIYYVEKEQKEEQT